MVVEIGGNRFALPFRTNIRHGYCYKFKSSGRESEASTGIDFTKAVVITDAKYVGEEVAIDHKEYVELMNKFYLVLSKFKRYLSGYAKCCREGGGERAMRKYRYTTLKYFKNELGLSQ